MTGAERTRLCRARKKAESLSYTKAEWREFVDPTNLQRKAGAAWQNMPAVVLRELADNAADAAGGTGAWIESGMMGNATWWCIGDYGDGIAPDQVAQVFSVDRPMESTKHVRLPTRGMLGNGTRVVAGFCAIEGLPIVVDSLGMRTVLRVDKATGRTVTKQQEPIESDAGTRVYLPQVAGLAKSVLST